MSRITLKQRHTGRIYLGMDLDGFFALRELIDEAEASREAAGLGLEEDEDKLVDLISHFIATNP